MQAILEISCGLDIHKESIEACILIAKGLNEIPTIIRETFSTLRGDLIKLSNWLKEKKCFNVAMESTGVYWKPIYEILEKLPNANLCLVNARHMRNLPGRKTDVKDAEWIATLNKRSSGTVLLLYLSKLKKRGSSGTVLLLYLSKLKKRTNRPYASLASSLIFWLTTVLKKEKHTKIFLHS